MVLAKEKRSYALWSTALAVLLVASSNSLAADRSLSDVNFTGPLITPNPNTLPVGMLNIEPYLVYVYSDAEYGQHGREKKLPNSFSQWQALIPVSYGITSRLTGQAIMGAVHASQAGAHTSAMRMTDTTLRLQYLLQAPNDDGTRPAISVALAQNVLTGSYDGLRDHPLNGQGNGAQQTTLSALAQQVIWMPNDRPLRWRGRLSWSPEPSHINLRGVSVYGTTSRYFRGKYHPGSNLDFSVGAEYSIDPQWVLAMDIAADRQGRGHLNGVRYMPDGEAISVHRDDSYSATVSVAPAIEYNINSSFGVIAGMQWSVAGHNTHAFISPQIALNMVF